MLALNLSFSVNIAVSNELSDVFRKAWPSVGPADKVSRNRGARMAGKGRVVDILD